LSPFDHAFYFGKHRKEQRFLYNVRPRRTGAKGKEERHMSLTRKMLKAMGIEDEKIDQIIEAHSETVDGLKADVQKYKGDAEKLPTVQKELDSLKAKGDDGWKDKHDKVKKEFDDYKAEIQGKESQAAKETAVKAYLESKNITGDNLRLAMRSIQSEIKAAEMEGNKLKDTKTFDDLLAGDLKGLITTTTEKGANPPANPPQNVGGTMTKDQIMGIKDRAERRAAIAANMSLFETKGD
jgi:hypothetical protein